MTSIAVQQMILVAISASILVVVRSRGRRGELSFVLAVMWLGIAVVGFLAAILLPNIDAVGALLGVLPAALFAGAASAILGLIALVLSFRVSRLEEQQRRLAEALGSRTGRLDGLKPEGPGATLVVVPALNEAASIGTVVEDLIGAGLPVLVVNDGSEDLTEVIAREAGAYVLTLPFNLGVGGALRAGLGVAVRAGFDQVVQCDADGQHPVASVLELLEAQSSRGADLLIGSRFVEPHARRREGFIRFLATLLLARIFSGAVGRPMTDATSGLRAIRGPLLKEFARVMPVHYLGDTFEANIMAGRAGYRIEEVPIRMAPRAHGSSSASTSDAIRLTIRGVLVALLRIPGIGIRRPSERDTQ